MSGIRRAKTKNELLIIERVGLLEYYNKMIVPLGSKYTPMSDQRVTGLCPFHEDTDPSLRYWKEKGILHCFGCGFGGDVVRIHSEIRRRYHNERLTVDQVVKQLSQLFGVELLSEEEGFAVESVFQRARSIILDKNQFKSKNGVFTLTDFKSKNKRIINSKVASHAKLKSFEQLDLLTSVEITKG